MKKVKNKLNIICAAVLVLSFAFAIPSLGMKTSAETGTSSHTASTSSPTTSSKTSSTDKTSSTSSSSGTSDTSSNKTSSTSSPSKDTSSDKSSSTTTSKTSSTSSKKGVSSAGAGGGKTFINEYGSTVTVPENTQGVTQEETVGDAGDDIAEEDYFTDETVSTMGKLIGKVIWIPILFAVLAIAGLIYVNVFYAKLFKGMGKKNKNDKSLFGVKPKKKGTRRSVSSSSRTNNNGRRR